MPLDLLPVLLVFLHHVLRSRKALLGSQNVSFAKSFRRRCIGIYSE